MIELTDGRRVVPTKEQLLESIKNVRRAIQADGNTSAITDGTIKSTTTENRRHDDATSTIDGLDESSERSTDYTNAGISDGLYSSSFETGRRDGSTNKRDGGTTTDEPEYPVRNEPIAKRSKFKAFNDFTGKIKDAIKSEKPKQKSKNTRKTLSDAEAKSIRLGLVEVILWQSEHMDEFIIATTRGHDHSIVIWSNLDREDAMIIADFLIESGKVNPEVAYAVRQMMSLKRRFQVGLILAPRLYQSYMVYLQRGFSIK